MMMCIAKRQELLGTVIEIQLPEGWKRLFPKCFAELKRIEETYSRFLESSELSKANRHIGKWQQVSPEFLGIVRAAEEMRRKTDGNFDITMKADLERLGYDAHYTFKKKAEKKSFHLPFLARLKIDPEKGLLLRREIDFGGLGKGFAIDCVAKLLDEQGVSTYCINAGGDLFAKGDSWPVLLEHPKDKERAIGKVMLKDGAIAASAANRRQWGDAHHLLNAKTRRPATGMRAVFVRAEKAIDADAYATALFTAGFEEAIRIVQEQGVCALLISQSDEMFQSDGFDAELYA